MDRPGTCPICSTPAREVDVTQQSGGPFKQSYKCPRCGGFVIKRNLAERIRKERPAWWFRLSASNRERVDHAPSGTSFDIDGRFEDFDSLLPTKGVREQIALLFRVIEDRTAHPGHRVDLDCDKDAVLVWAQNREEVLFLLSALMEQGYVERQGDARGHSDPRRHALITPKGFAHLEELDRSAVLKDRVFVAMWFPSKDHEEHDRMFSAYSNGIRRAIESAGLKPFRVDLEPSDGQRIDARIMVEIRRSRAVVADATGHRPSVAYEAGFAEGLGKPVIWTVREGQLKDLPFDTRQFPHLEWTSPEQLARDLQPVIENRLGSRR